MQQILSKYKNCGEFFFSLGSLLSNVCNAPPLYGVYIIYAIVPNVNDKLLYIGKGGSIKTNATFKNQKLCGRINATRGNGTAQTYFTTQMNNLSIQTIRFNWYVTFQNQLRDIPGCVEALLIQRYFQIYGALPPWNVCF